MTYESFLDTVRKAVEDSAELPRYIAIGSGIGESTLSKFCRGQRRLGVKSLMKVVNYLNVEVPEEIQEVLDTAQRGRVRATSSSEPSSSPNRLSRLESARLVVAMDEEKEKLAGMTCDNAVRYLREKTENPSITKHNVRGIASQMGFTFKRRTSSTRNVGVLVKRITALQEELSVQDRMIHLLCIKSYVPYETVRANAERDIVGEVANEETTAATPLT